MKKNILLLLLFTLLPVYAFGQLHKKDIRVNKAGTLSSIISPTESDEVSHLKLTGTINAVDFKMLKEHFKNLEELDLRDVEVRNYLGKNGTASDRMQLYPNHTIPSHAFATFTDYTATGKNSLKKIILPQTIKGIGKAAFANCQNLTVMVIPADAPPTLGDNALAAQRTAIFINNSVKEDYNYNKDWGKFTVIENEPVYVDIELDEANTLAQNLIRQNKQPSSINFLTIKGKVGLEDLMLIRNYMPNLVSVDIEKTDIESIPEFTFATKVTLLNIELPEKLNSIGTHAFEGCTRLGPIVRLPKSVSIIEEDAFANCDKLDAVIVTGKLKALAENIFGAKSDNKFIFKE